MKPKTTQLLTKRLAKHSTHSVYRDFSPNYARSPNYRDYIVFSILVQCPIVSHEKYTKKTSTEKLSTVSSAFAHSNLVALMPRFCNETENELHTAAYTADPVV